MDSASSSESNRSYENIKKVVNELFASFKMQSFKQASQLCSKLAFLLVNLFDDDFTEVEKIGKITQSNDNLFKLKQIILSLVCNELRTQSLMLEAYASVLEFVAKMDLLAITSNTKNSTRCNEQDQLVLVFRQCLYLLRTDGSKPFHHMSENRIWFNHEKLSEFLSDKNSFVNFSFISLNELIIVMENEYKSFLGSENYANLDFFLDQFYRVSLSGDKENENNFSTVLRQDWFKQFTKLCLQSSERQCCLLDSEKRTVVLSALLIVACLAPHKELASLAYESLTLLTTKSGQRMFATSNAPEELILSLGFSRSGQAWLTCNKDLIDAMLLSNNLEDDDYDDDDDNVEDELSVVSRESVDFIFSKSHDDKKTYLTLAKSKRNFLKQLIENEIDGLLCCFACGKLRNAFCDELKIATSTGTNNNNTAITTNISVSSISSGHSNDAVLTNNCCSECGQQKYVCAQSFEQLPLADLSCCVLSLQKAKQCSGRNSGADEFEKEREFFCALVSNVVYLRAMLSKLSVGLTKLSLPSTPFVSDNVVVDGEYKQSTENLTLNIPQSSSNSSIESATSSSASTPNKNTNSSTDNLSFDDSRPYNNKNNNNSSFNDVKYKLEKKAQQFLDNYWSHYTEKDNFSAKKNYLTKTFKFIFYRSNEFKKETRKLFAPSNSTLTTDDSLLFLMIFRQDLLLFDIVDKLEVDKLEKVSKIKLLAKDDKRKLFIAACNSRSTISQASLGCQRIYSFKSIEEKLECKHCKLDLRLLVAFDSLSRYQQ